MTARSAARRERRHRALCVRAILEHRPRCNERSRWSKNGLAFIESKIQGDGGIYARGSRYRNYETSVAVGALLKANKMVATKACSNGPRPF